MSNEFAPYKSLSVSFVIKNTTPQKKRIRVFGVPINYQNQYDLMQISGISESDIRSSLLKGELNHRIRALDIQIISSDIDILQFNLDNKSFLERAGLNFGHEITSTNLDVIKYKDIILIGNVDGVNTSFKIPNGFYIQNNIYKITVYLNGIKQNYSDDYYIGESFLNGSGFDTVIFAIAPSYYAGDYDVITADYYLEN